MVTKIAAIPSPTDANLKEVARAIKNVLDVREGVAGDPLDSSVTFRDLVDGGLLSVTVTRRGAQQSITDVTPTNGGDTEYDPTKDLAIPPAPQGFVAAGLFAAVALAWTGPPVTFRNFAYTEIWRAATDEIGSAIRIATTQATAFVDYIGNAETRYYWVRFISAADIAGPYNATSGTVATTTQNPGLLLDSLIGAINASHLASSLTSRIDLIDGNDTLAGSVNERILLETNARIAALASEASTRSSADNLLQAQIDALSGGGGGDLSGLITAINQEIADRIAADLAESNARQIADAAIEDLIDLEADARQIADSALSAVASAIGTSVLDAVTSLLAEKNARTLADQYLAQESVGLASRISDLVADLFAEASARAIADQYLNDETTGLKARVTAVVADLFAESGARALADQYLALQAVSISRDASGAVAAVFQEASTRASADEAVASSISGVVASLGSNAAAIATEQVARVTEDSATASKVETIAAQTGANNAAIQTESLARTTADSSLASQSVIIAAQTGQSVAAIQTEQSARTDADSALATSSEVLFAQVGSNTAAIQSEKEARASSDEALSSVSSVVIAQTGLNAAAIVQEQSARTTADSAVATSTAILTAQVDSSRAAIQSEQTVRASGDEAIASAVDSLSVQVGASLAAIVSEQYTSATEDAALASTVTTIAAQTGDNTSAITSESIARTSTDEALAATTTTLISQSGNTTALIKSEGLTRAAGDDALATTTSALVTASGSNASAISSEQIARSSADDAIASTSALLTAQAGANTAALQTEQSARADADSASAGTAAVLGASVGQSLAGLTAEQSVRASADSAAASSITGLLASTGANSAAISSEQTARSDQTSALAAQSTALLATANDATAAIFQEIQARTDVDSAVASQVSSLTVTLADKATVASVDALTVQIGNIDGQLVAQASQISELAASLDTIADVDAALQIETIVRASETEALTQTTQTLYASYESNFAAIQQEAQARADADSAEASARLVLSARVTSVEGDVIDNAAAILSEQTARATEDAALAGQTTSVSTAVGDSQSAVRTEAESRASADSASAGQITTVGAATSSAISGITSSLSSVAATDSAYASQLNALVAATSSNSAGISTEQTVRSDSDVAIASTVSVVGAVAANSAAAILTEQSARAAQDSAIAQQTNSIAATVDDNLAAIASEQTSRADADSANALQISALTAATSTTNASVYSEQTARATADSATAGQFGSIVSSVGSSAGSIFSEQNTRASADSAQASQSSALLSTTQANSAGIISESMTRSSETSAAASTVSGLVASVGATSSGLLSEQLSRASETGALASEMVSISAATNENAAALVYERSARSDETSSLASEISTLTAASGANSAAITTEQQTRASEIGALSSQVTTLSALREEDEAALELEAFVRNIETENLLAQYTVKVDVNGYVSGYGLASEKSNGRVTSEFAIRADRFYVASPTGPGITPVVPFVVQTTQTTAPNGATISPGVYMDAAYIKNATITAAKISDVDADTIKAGYLQTVDFAGSTLVGSELYIGGTVTYEYNYPGQPTRITGVASVANPNIALKSTGAEFAVNYFKLKSSASATASDVFTVVNGNVVLNADKINATTLSAITSNLGTVNAGVVQSTDGKAKFDLNNARIVFNNGTHMKVVGNGFGQNSDLLEWYGPTQSEASNFAACTTANGYSYVKATTTAGGLTTGTIAFMRALRIGDHNGNIVLDAGTGTYADAIRNGAITISGGQLSGIGTTGVTIDNTYAPNSQNLVPNSDLAVALTPWVLGWVQNGGTDIVVGRDYPSSNWHPVGGHAFGLRRFGNALTGAIDLRLNDNSKIPVLPNTRYELSGYVASHRCDCAITVWFYDSTGTYITGSEVANQPARSAGGTNLADWARPFLFVTTPANARTCLVGIRVYAVDGGQTDGYAWLTKMYFGQANTNQTAASPWGPAAFTGVDQLGYTGDLAATKNNIYRQTTAPTGGSYTTGDLWIDTDAVPTTVSQWNGSAWSVVGNYTTNTSQLTDGANLGGTAAWTGVSGTGKPADNATRNVIYRQASQPTGGTYTTGDLWYDSDSNPVTLYSWSGSAWTVTANNVTNTNQVTDGANLGGTAVWSGVSGDGRPADNATKNTLSYGASTPTGTNGDLWVNTGVTPNVLNVYQNGWVVASNKTTEIGGSGVNHCNPRYTIFNETSLPPVIVNSGTATLDSAVGYIGLGALKLTATAADAHVYLSGGYDDYNMAIQPNRSWIVSAWVMSPNVASAAGQFYLRTEDQTFHVGYYNTSATIGAWTRVSVLITSTSGNASARALLRVDTDVSGTIVYFDGLMVEAQVGQISTPSAFVAPPNFLSLYTGALNATKNTVTRSTSDPANAATTDGDIWIDTDASPSQLVYVRSGGAWQVSANYLSAGTQLSDYNALSNANITLNSDGSLAGAGGGTAAPFEPYHAAMWDFRGTVVPWGGVNCTVSAGNDVLIQTGTATANPYVRILHGGISIPGEIFNKVRIKYRRTVGTGAWKGHVYYTTAAHTGFTATYRKIIAAPVATIVNGDWYISEWDMSTLTDGGTDWVTSTITGLRFDFTSSANETWEVDWVIVGRYGSGEWTFNTINPTNQLTSGNIGTYIQNLAVGTLQIGSGTVTVPTIAINTSSVTTNPTTYVTLVTLNVTISSTGDATVDNNIPFVLKWAFESVGQVSGPVARSVQIRRTAPSALTVYTSSTQTRDVQDFVSGVAQTTLTAGSQHTFVLEVRGGANTINRSSLWTMAARR